MPARPSLRLLSKRTHLFAVEPEARIFEFVKNLFQQSFSFRVNGIVYLFSMEFTYILFCFWVNRYTFENDPYLKQEKKKKIRYE